MKTLLTYVWMVCCFAVSAFAAELPIDEIPQAIEKVLNEKPANAREQLSVIENSLKAAPKDSKNKMLHQLLYVDFLFHRAAQDCHLPLAELFLNQIENSIEVDEYVFKVRKPYGEIQINPYHQAVIASCLDVVVAIDIKISQTIKINLKTYQDPYADCNSNLHLAVSSTESKKEINRELVGYFLKDTLTAFLKNMEDCRAVDILDLNKHVTNYAQIRYDLEIARQMSNNHLNEKFSVDRLNNCRSGYQHFVHPKKTN